MALVAMQAGCTPQQYAHQADKSSDKVLTQKQRQSLGVTVPFSIAYRPIVLATQPASQPATMPATVPASAPASAPAGRPTLAASGPASRPVRTVSLNEALDIAVHNSRSYQDRKEELYKQALALANLRHKWSGVTGDVSGNGNITKVGDNPTVYTGTGNANAAFTQYFANGGSLALGAALSAATNFLEMNGTTFPSLLNASFVQPLLRGGGRGLAYEPLFRAERDLAINTLDYFRYTQTFAVDIARNYYNVLTLRDILGNEYENLRRLEDTFKFVQAQVEGGMVSRVQADQAEQDVLSARERIEQAAQAYSDSLDRFKITLGLPMATNLELDSGELAALVPLPLPMDEARSVETALHVRPDVLKDYAKVRDSVVDVELAADKFNPLLNVTVGTTVPGQLPHQPFNPQFRDWTRLVNVQFDYPLDQTDNRDVYRRSLIDADKAKRDSDEFLDTVRLNVRSDYRSLTTLERSYEIQRLSVDLALRRSQLAQFEQKEGLATTRDVLDAEDSLRSSKNALIGALVGYYTQRLTFLANLGMIRVDAQGKFYERNEPFYFDRPSRFP